MLQAGVNVRRNEVEVDGKPSMGMPPPVPADHCRVRCPESGGYLGRRVLFGNKGCLCCVWHRHKNSFGGITRRGRLLDGRDWLETGALCGCP